MHPTNVVTYPNEPAPLCVSLEGPPSIEEAHTQQVKHIKWDQAAGSRNAWSPTAIEVRAVAGIDKAIHTIIHDSLGRVFPGLKHPIVVEVEPMALGGYGNSLFIVQASCGDWEKPLDLVFRFAIPMNPWYKTHAEVATMMYIRHYTTIPVPRIYAFDASTSNPLGLEWMMMERISGTCTHLSFRVCSYNFQRYILTLNSTQRKLR